MLTTTTTVAVITMSIPTTVHEEDDLSGLDSWDPMAEDYHSMLNTLVLDPNNDPECVVTGKQSDDGTTIGKHRICGFYLKHGRCMDGEYCDRLHIKPKDRDKIWILQNAYKSKKDRLCLSYCYLSPIDLEPNPSELLLVSVTMAKSPGNFYIVAPYEKMNFASFNQHEIDFYIKRVQHSSSIKTKLQKCHEQLATLFDHNYRMDNLKDDIYLGQVVACKLRGGRFCRAMVIETEDLADDKFLYKLFLIDVGIEVELAREAIYDIKAHCLSEPPIAINCRLDLKPAPGSNGWSQDALDFFSSQVDSEKYFLCKVTDYIELDRMYTVDLLTVDGNESLTQKMISSGLARPFNSTD